jgi:ribosomal-protein-alanine N-acetyltransferase
MPSSSTGVEGSLRFGAMRLTDVDAVARIEAASFPLPWTRAHFRHELERNPLSVNRVFRRDGAVIGYASVWIIDHELQINKIAIDGTLREKGLGRLLMERLLELAAKSRCRRITLEVRPGNTPARALYESLGFREVGRRADYYGPREDAILLRLDRSTG